MLSFRAYSHWLLITLLTLGYVFGAAAASAANKADTLLMSATYQGKISGWNVELKRTLIHFADGRYQLRTYANKMFASIDEVSIFTLHQGQIQPQQYVYRRNVFGKKSVEKIVFDWTTGQAQYTRSDRSQSNSKHTLQPGLLDPALYQLAIQADLAKGQDGLRYRFIKRKRIEQYHLRTMDQETIRLGGQSYDATVVLREDPDSDKATKVWVAPKLHYLITNIRHVDKGGDEFAMTLTRFDVDEAELHEFYRAFSNNRKFD